MKDNPVKKCLVCGASRSKAGIGAKFNVPFRCKECGAIKFPWRPLRDIVFMYPDEIPEKTDGGIIVPDIVRELYRESGELYNSVGTVLAVGKGYTDDRGKFRPTTVKSGDRVNYTSSVPWHMDFEGIDGKKHKVRMMGERDIRAVVNDKTMGGVSPIFDRLLVRVIPKAESKTKSGIVIPILNVPSRILVEIVKIGSGVDSTLSVGDRVCMMRHDGTNIFIDDGVYKIVICKDILFIVEGEQEVDID